jgi:hypothetical protein
MVEGKWITFVDFFVAIDVVTVFLVSRYIVFVHELNTKSLLSFLGCLLSIYIFVASGGIFVVGCVVV